MDDSSKLGLAVVAAAAILVGGYVAYNEYARARDVDQAQQVLDQLRQSGQHVVDQYQQSVQQVQTARWQETIYDWERRQDALERRHLAPNQRCVGGSVVQVQGNVYTQLGTIAQPIHCDGVYADQPLR